MTGPQAVEALRIRTGTQNMSIPLSVYYYALTEGHKKVITDLSANNADIKNLYSRYETNIVANQDLYDRFPLQIVDKVEIKLDEKFFPAKQIDSTLNDTSFQGKTRDQLISETSIERPLVDILGNKIQIFPKPTKDVVRGIVVEGKSINVAAITAETTLVLYGKLQNYENLLISAARSFVFEYIRDNTSAGIALKDYITELENSSSKLSNLNGNPETRELEKYHVRYR